MKQKAILIFLAIFLGLGIMHGQAKNFKNENGVLIWQKIYERDSSLNIIDLFATSGIIENIIIKESQIMGDLKPFDIDFRGAGFTALGTPIYVSSSKVKAYIMVELRDNRYRVTLKDITLIQMNDEGISKHSEETSLSVYALKGVEFRSAFLKTPAAVYDYSFEKRLKMYQPDEKW